MIISVFAMPILTLLFALWFIRWLVSQISGAVGSLFPMKEDGGGFRDLTSRMAGGISNKTAGVQQRINGDVNDDFPEDGEDF